MTFCAELSGAQRQNAPALLAMLTFIVAASAAPFLEIREAGVAPPVVVALHAPSVVKAPVMSDHSEEQLATIRARPLFSPSRRPAVAAVVPGIDMPRLTGIVIDVVERWAIFAGAENAKPVVVEEGGALGEWLVRSIAKDSVTLASSSGIRVLHSGFEKPNPEPDHQAASPPHRKTHAAWKKER